MRSRAAREPRGRPPSRLGGRQTAALPGRAFSARGSREDADNRQGAAAQRRRLRREPGEVVLSQLQRGHRVVGVRVEAGREEDGLRVEGPDRGKQVLGPSAPEGLGAAAGGQRRAHNLPVQPVAAELYAFVCEDARLE